MGAAEAAASELHDAWQEHEGKVQGVADVPP
jgi:hypothetical protein